MTPATEEDRAEIEALLTPHAHLAMFPLSNLALHGFGSDHPNGCLFWLTRRGAASDLLALSNGGMVMPFLPSGDYAAAARVLKGRSLAGFVGPREAVRGVEALLALRGPRHLDADEPHFLLQRSDLVIPEGPGQIVPLAEAPEAVITSWMLAYQTEALNTPADQAPQRVRESYARYVQAGSHVALMDQGRPLAMSGFNARLPDIVQVGGVYTPPELRGQGHAGRCVALHLAGSGATRATLFSASEKATRAYRRIGFRQVGDWALVLLQDKEIADA